MGWLMGKGLLGSPRLLWIGLAVLAAIAAVIVAYTKLIDKQDDIAKDNQEVGAAIQREQDLQETVRRVEEADDVRNEVSAEAAVGRGNRLYAQCLRTARTPANCERFLSGGQAD